MRGVPILTLIPPTHTNHCRQMTEDQDWILLGRYFSGECPPREEAAIEARIAQDLDFAAEVRDSATIRNIGTTPAASARPGDAWDTEGAWQKVARRVGVPAPAPKKVPASRSLPDSSRHWYQNAAFRIAASVVLIVGLGIVGYSLLRPNNARGPFNPSHMVKLANGQKMNLILPDGTEVTLNAGSIFAYSNYFNSGDREVRIEGEAFFNVAKNNGTPFIVHAGSARLRVIGTEFSVKAWPEVTEVRLVVREGNVAFSAENDALGEQAVVVRRGEVSTLAGGRVSPPWKASLDNELAWLRGELVFEATPFEHVIRSLERKFDIHCTVSDSTILGRQLTATFKDETTDEVLDVIALSLQLAYSRNQDSVTFAPRDR